MKNPILEELWKVKDEIACECEYDLNKLAERLRKRQQEEKRQVANFSEKQTGNPATPK
jgi:hypothetical protein